MKMHVNRKAWIYLYKAYTQTLDMQYKSLSTVGPVVLRDSLPVVHSTGVVWGSWSPCLVKSTIGFFGTAVAAVAAVAVGVDVTATVAVFLSMSVLSSFSGWMVCFGCILTLDRWWTLVTSQASWVHLYRTLIYNDLLWSIVIYCDLLWSVSSKQK